MLHRQRERLTLLSPDIAGYRGVRFTAAGATVL
jgi:hypothetical protein